MYGTDVLGSVKNCFLVAVCDVSETRTNLEAIFGLLSSLDLTNPKKLPTILKVIAMFCIIFGKNILQMVY